MKRKDDPEDLNVEEVRTEQDRLCSVHHKWLKELFVAVRGNGDVKHGLEYKVQTLLDRQDIVVKLLWLVTSAALLTFTKVIGEPLLKLIFHGLEKL